MAWLIPSLLYLMPRTCLLGCASLTLPNFFYFSSTSFVAASLLLALLALASLPLCSLRNGSLSMASCHLGASDPGSMPGDAPSCVAILLLRVLT